MDDDKNQYWYMVWTGMVKGLGVEGLTGWTDRPGDLDVVKFCMAYHGRGFSHALTVKQLLSPKAEQLIGGIAEKLVAEICESLAKGLEDLVPLIPNGGVEAGTEPKVVTRWDELFENET